MWSGEAFCFGKNARDGVDSDQSISEEDESLDGEYSGNTISLGGTADKSEGMQVLCQLEILRDSCIQFANEKECFSSHERKAGCFSEDEVENPLFDDEDGSTSPLKFTSASHSIKGVMHLPMASKSHYDEEIISDGEALQESCSPILRSGATAYSKTNKFVADSQLISFPKESEKSDSHEILSEVARKDNIKQNSVAKSLDYFYNNCATHRGNPEPDIMKRRTEAPMIPERKASSLGYGILDEDDDDELPEAFDDSSGDEENPQRSKLAIPVRTMADQFCEAFGTVSGLDVKSHLTLPGPLCGSRTNGKLQLLLQAEKERDIEYMKSISAGTNSIDERNSIKVRILSRRLEAKLVVCSCTAIGDGKAKGISGSLTVIFNPRICSDVELEVDNVICIHSPWKEVQVNGKDEVVLLSSYYCLTHL